MKKPKYYRDEFETLFPWFYDALVWIAFFGKEKKARRLISEKIPTKSKKILDLATGTGSVAIEIKKRYPDSSVIGVDLSGKMLNVALRKISKENIDISFLQQNIEKTDFNKDSFDAVTISFGLHEMPHKNRLNVMNEAYRILRKGGMFIILELNRPDKIISKIMFYLHMNLFEPDFAKSILDENIVKELTEIGFKNMNKEKCLDGYVQLFYGVK
ncbi:MAG: class I SAM-dependent methyltransferase [Candidatus Woesearchaeota archaeon]